MESKKINFIVPGLGNSGGIKVIDKYAELLRKNGYDVIIYSPVLAYNLHRFTSEIKNIIHQLYCTVKTIPFVFRRKDRKWVFRINSHSIRQADYTIATMWATAYDVARLSDICGKKIYFIQDYEIWDNEKLGKESYRLPLKKIVISTWINEQLKRNLDIGPFPIVYNGLDLEYIQDVNKDGDVKCLMLYHEMPKKGVVDGLSVFEKTKEKHPEIKLTMFGMFKKPCIPKYVKYVFNPEKDKLLELYREADIFIFPSHSEGWGLPPLEAMGAGCSVIGTKAGFVFDLGKDRENMLIYEIGDVEGMVKGLDELINDKDLRTQIGNSGRKTAKKLEWDSSLEHLLNRLED